MAKKILSFLLALVLIVVVAAAFNLKVNQSQADADVDLRGWAWSSNIGWISFNSSNSPGGSPQNFKVTLKGDGKLEGYAWSSNIGWIRFGEPGKTLAQVSGTNASGWAKALSGGSAESGGWDGWIKLAKESGDTGANYGVKLKASTADGSKTFYDFAWGGEVVGWVNFNPNLPIGATPPDVPCDPVANPKVCAGGTTTTGLAVACAPSVTSATANVTAVTWTANTPSGGVAPYTYSWSGTESLSGTGGPGLNVTPATKTYTTAGTKSASLQITDSSPTPLVLNQACLNTVSVGACTAGNMWNGSACVPIPAGTGGDLEIDQGSSHRISIIQQSIGAKAATRPVVIVNAGDTTLNNVRVVGSILGRTGTALNEVASVQCRLSPNATAQEGDWQSCTGLSFPSLAPLSQNSANKLYFAIRIPSYDKSFNTNSPYTVNIVAETPGPVVENVPLKNATGSNTAIIFEYLVGGVNPQ